MPLSSRERLLDDLATPRIAALWQALTALRSVASLMQSGAHPDDETSAMLAALRFRDGLSIAYACSTRGEGGQNDIGPETVRDIGTIRTAEMERACDRLDMRMYWLSETPEDPIFDFGFSKSGKDTLRRWGRERTLARFVEIVRTERPDMICPTFLDVGGQHGHHRAMTEMAHEVFEAAADPAFPGSTLEPWAVAKLYLPGWGGGGGSYDDDEPPPATTFTVPGKGSDPVTGWSWETIAQGSRVFHLTQGMGRWVAPGTERDWPLHLAASRVGADAGAVTDNLALTLADLGLAEAQAAIEAALAAFPDFGAVARAAARALAALDAARVAPEHGHRIALKRRQLARVLRLSSGLAVRAWTEADLIRPGETTRWQAAIAPGEASEIALSPDLPPGWSAEGEHLTVLLGTPPSDPYPARYDPLEPPLPALTLAFTAAGARTGCRLAFERPPLAGALPAASLHPEAALINLALPPAPFDVALSDLHPADAVPGLDLPEGWRQDLRGATLRLTPPAALAPGLTEAALTLGGTPALTEHRFGYPHIAPRLRAFPAVLRLRAVHAELPEGRVGYVGTGNDRVGHWLRAMGLSVEELTDARLAAEAPFEGLSAVVVGVFGFRRPALSAALPKLHHWVRAGGKLVTLYHRPGDNWQPATTPLAPIRIGAPSLRWRVTDAGADVMLLEPRHPVFAGPNPIGPEDWQGWHKERGLYFASDWDPAYTPLVTMADPQEQPHRGALLSGDFGAGRHIHCALGLHHQMNELVPGAYRLMANFLA